MALLSREAILAADDKPTRLVDVPEWGGSVRVRSISAAERDDFEEAQLVARREGRLLPRQVRARMVAFCVVDEAGARLFSDEDVEALGEPDVDALLGRLTSRQFQEWIAFHSLEPWGSRREDLRFGVVAATVHAMQRGRGSEPRGPEDFFPLPSQQEQKAVAGQRLKQALGARRRKKKG